MRVTIATFFVVMSVSTAPVVAQEDIPSGARIRITHITGERDIGRFVSASPDLVQLRGDRSGAMHIPRDRIKTLERSMGVDRDGRYFTYTVAALIAVGAVWGLTELSEPCSGWCLVETTESTAPFVGTGLGMIVGAVIGLPLGVILWGITGQERWVDVTSLPDVSIEPRRVRSRLP